MNIPIRLISALLSSIVLFTACKKEKAPSWTGCRVKNIKETLNDSLTPRVTDYQLIYNDDGKVQQITGIINDKTGKQNLTKVFKYTASTIEILVWSNGSVTAKDSLTLDAQGRIGKIFRVGSTGKLDPSWREYAYDNEGHVTLIRKHSGANTSVDSAFWDNGDVIRYGAAYSYAFAYNFYDTAYNIGLIKAPLDELLSYGRGIFLVNRLEKSKYFATYPSVVYARSYTLDTDGKILEMISKDQAGRATSWKIGYDCH